MVQRRERGKDGVLTVAGSQYEFSNCEFTIEYETDTSDRNHDFFQYTSVISGRASGTFEWPGSQTGARDALIDPNTGEPRLDLGLQVNLTEETFRANRVVIESYERTAPTDGQTGGTIEWSADRFRIVE